MNFHKSWKGLHYKEPLNKVLVWRDVLFNQHKDSKYYFCYNTRHSGKKLCPAPDSEGELVEAYPFPSLSLSLERLTTLAG